MFERSHEKKSLIRGFSILFSLIDFVKGKSHLRYPEQSQEISNLNGCDWRGSADNAADDFSHMRLAAAAFVTVNVADGAWKEEKKMKSSVRESQDREFHQHQQSLMVF